MKTLKQNVNEFNIDVKKNNGYRYTTNAKYSSVVSNNRITKATENLIPINTATIIDIGCGDGAYTIILKEKFKNIKFTGIDPAFEAIELAKKKDLEINFLIGDLLDESTLPKEKYELGIIRGVLHHLPNAYKGLENSKKLSNRLIIIEPNGNNPILKWIEKNSKYHIEHEEQSFTSKQLSRWIEMMDYKIVKIDYIGFIPFFFPTVLSKIINFFQPFLELIYPLKKYFGAQIIILCENKK
jgi:SAM-dependent methyltransferase